MPHPLLFCFLPGSDARPKSRAEAGRMFDAVDLHDRRLRTGSERLPGVAPVVDVVVPVYNEAPTLAAQRAQAARLPDRPVPVLVAHHDRRQRVDRRHLGARNRPRARSHECTGPASRREGARAGVADRVERERRGTSSRTWTSTSRRISTRCSRSWLRSCPDTPMSRSARGSRPVRPSLGVRSASCCRAGTTSCSARCSPRRSATRSADSRPCGPRSRGPC